MSDKIEFRAQARSDLGKGASRRLRRAGMVPGILYGARKDPEMIALKHNQLLQQLEQESVFSTIVTVEVDGRKQEVILKDLQRHPSRPIVQHVDFQRISAREKIRTNIPIHLLGEESAVGVKMGGAIYHHITDVEVSCLPKDLPEFLEIDVEQMEVGDSVKLSEIALPEGVEIPILNQGEEFDVPVVSLQVAKMAEVEPEEVEEEALVEAEAAEEEEAEPED